MKYISLVLFLILLFPGCKNSEKENLEPTSTSNTAIESNEPWDEEDLLDPEKLANWMSEEKINPKRIISIGFENVIQNSVDLGPANNPAKLDELRAYLEKIPKDSEIILYCGCCPFKDCPNIRPAMKLAKEMNLERAKLLNIENNIRTDWIDHGYPIN